MTNGRELPKLPRKTPSAPKEDWTKTVFARNPDAQLLLQDVYFPDADTGSPALDKVSRKGG
jgi:hypothetical protein